MEDGSKARGGHERRMRYAVLLQPQFTEGSETPYGNNPEAGHYVTSGDAKIYYEVYGLGDDVVILNEGGTGCSYELGSMIDEIREYYRVIVVSSRGQGKSEMGHIPFSLSQKAADVLAVIHEEAEDPVMIVGVGDGAYAAMEAAIEEPEIVDRIVAIGAGTLKKGFIPSSIPYSDVVNADPDLSLSRKPSCRNPKGPKKSSIRRSATSIHWRSMKISFRRSNVPSSSYAETATPTARW